MEIPLKQFIGDKIAMCILNIIFFSSALICIEIMNFILVKVWRWCFQQQKYKIDISFIFIFVYG